jgi:AcrR family transcriptional regulator
MAVTGRVGNGAGGAKRRRSTRSLVPAPPRLRHPGTVLGPRANRTIASILDATRQIFLVRGYAGTTIDEIARVAGVSRGSFYTYFPSKRDVLLALGADSLGAGRQLIKALDDFPHDWEFDDLRAWVRAYFELLDEYGSFAFAWTQAAHEDDEILAAGVRGHVDLCRRLGIAVARLNGKAAKNPAPLGLAVLAMLERSWAYAQLYERTLDTEDLQRTIARMLAATAEAL